MLIAVAGPSPCVEKCRACSAQPEVVSVSQTPVDPSGEFLDLFAVAGVVGPSADSCDVHEAGASKYVEVAADGWLAESEVLGEEGDADPDVVRVAAGLVGEVPVQCSTRAAVLRSPLARGWTTACGYRVLSCSTLVGRPIMPLVS